MEAAKALGGEWEGKVDGDTAGEVLRGKYFGIYFYKKKLFKFYSPLQ